jgi:single-stranded-DNA-specific exonuclease
MEKIKDIFVDFGGHAMSGGFSISHEKIDFLDDALNEAYSLLPIVEEAAETPRFDAELTKDDLTMNMLSSIEKMAPFGVGNPKPLFLIKEVIPRSVKSFGKSNAHTEVTIEGPRGSIQAIAFFKPPSHFKTLVINRPISIIGSLERSYWKSPLRIRIVDIV